MSQSVQAWLFNYCASSACMALEAGYDLNDLPFVPGNRVQVLRFLTYRPVVSAKSRQTDIWALVGDRTHCIGARISRQQVDRFQAEQSLRFTALKGALLTLTSLRITVERVQVEEARGGASGVPYRAGQYALVLDVRACSVVSSINEPVWYAGVKLVTSVNGVPCGDEDRAAKMMVWMKQWIRYKSLQRRARIEQGKQQRRRNHPDSNIKLDPQPALDIAPNVEADEQSTITNNALPTPAQRNPPILAPISPQELELRSTSKQTQWTPSLDIDSSTSSCAALWTDFNLDDVDVPPQSPDPTETLSLQQDPLPLQTATPDESALSDQPQSRLSRKSNKRKRQQALAAL